MAVVEDGVVFQTYDSCGQRKLLESWEPAALLKSGGCRTPWCLVGNEGMSYGDHNLIQRANFKLSWLPLCGCMNKFKLFLPWWLENRVIGLLQGLLMASGALM